MMTKAIFYLRVSTDRQTDGAAAQLEMLRAAAASVGIAFPVTSQDLSGAIATRRNEVGPLYLDFGISGYFDSTRPGYQSFLKRALTDKAVTHVFTPARDRIARPEDAAEFASRENRIRAAGKTLVVGTKVLPPLRRGDDNTVDTITASLEYSQGRAYLDHLANKMVTVKANKAKAGCWTGGRAPYGFVRVLINPQGDVERALKDGESVRQPGYNVSLRVGDVERIRVWHDLILKTFDPAGENVGGKQVANLLNERNIPSADAGRIRRTKYEETAREVPGTWTPGMVYALLDNPAIVGVLRYGKRSMGEHARLGENGIPRKLTTEEAPSLDVPAKIVENPEDIQISVAGGWMQDDGWLIDASGKKCFKVDLELWKRCQQKRKENAGTQRGLSRCHDPYKYPMAGMLRCEHCGSVMHGIPYGKTLRYVCGTYANSGGAKCEHNWVAQEEMLPRVLQVIQENALPSVEELRNTLRKLVADTKDRNQQDSATAALRRTADLLPKN
jgi:DNA invertase Pin-like site-specific DNA recombinase